MTVISTVRSQPPMVADELRRQSDIFIELDDIRDQIERESNHRQDNGQDNDFLPPEYEDPQVEIA